ncbi:MAG: NAD(P)-dependent oxidoreductase [Erythrobacter sp.]|nr:MAG: NAD(P)-dependent oxidoreductase [Erythrobacter sp.]
MPETSNRRDLPVPAGGRVLVTGDAGFIGKWLCRLLVAEGYEVTGLDQRAPQGEITWQHINCDLLDREGLDRAFAQVRPQALLHLAARTDLEGKTLEDYEANRGGVRNLCELVAATDSVTRAIYTSSQLVCGVGHVPKSDHEYLPSTVYGESKIATEMIVRECDGGGVTWCLTRPTTGWGPEMSPHYTSVLRLIDKGLFFHSGPGALNKSYFYVENIAWQYLQLLRADAGAIQGNVFYLADYEPFSLRDYINACAKSLGKRPPPTFPLPLVRGLALAGDVLRRLGLPAPFTGFRLRNIRTEYQFDMELTRRVCGPLPISFEEGVRRTIRWYRQTQKGQLG